jgi:hypothetical protein
MGVAMALARFVPNIRNATNSWFFRLRKSQGDRSAGEIRGRKTLKF